MSAKIKNIWDRISNLGVHPGLESKEREKVILVNRIITFAIVIDILLFFNHFYFPVSANDEHSHIIFAAIVNSLVYYFNYKRYYIFSRSYIIIMSTFFACLSIAFLGPEYRIEVILLVIMVFSMIIFDKTSLRLIHGFIIIAFFLLARVIYAIYGPFEFIVINSTSNVTLQNRFDLFFVITLFLIGALSGWYINIVLKLRNQSEKLNRDLSVVNQEMERFAYIASHDMKTPLRTVVSFLGIIEHKLNQKEYEGLDEYMKFAQDGATQMHHLITDILEYAKLSNSESNVEQVNLNNIFSKVVNQINDAESPKEILKSNDLPSLKANESKMTVLFQNLIDNGLKYNQEPNPVVNVQSKRLPGQIVLEFIDNGIGIDPKYREQIFGMFKRLHNNATYEGTGIGLSICKKIVDSMNGDIEVSSNAKGGSTFKVTLPA